MPLAGLEPAIPASKRPQSHALDSALTGIGAFDNSDFMNILVRFSKLSQIWIMLLILNV